MLGVGSGWGGHLSVVDEGWWVGATTLMANDTEKHFDDGIFKHRLFT